MPVRKDEFGNYHYIPGPAVTRLGPDVASAVTGAVQSQLPPVKLPSPNGLASQIISTAQNPEDLDVSSHEQQRNQVQGMLADEQGLITQAEARGLNVPNPIKGRGTGVMDRIFDVLSRPNYAVANTAAHLLGYSDDYTEADDPLEAAWEGLSGNAKTSFTRMYSEKVDPNAPSGSIRGPVGAGIVGLISDVVLDPTTYIGLGAVRQGGQMLAGGGKAAEAVDSASDLGKALSTIKPSLSQRVISASREAPNLIHQAANQGSNLGRAAAFRQALQNSGKANPIPSGTVSSSGRTLIRSGDPKAMQHILKSEPLLQPGNAAKALRAKIGKDAETTFENLAKSRGINTSTSAFRHAQKQARGIAIANAIKQAQGRMDDAISTYRTIDKVRDTSIGLKIGKTTVVQSRSAGRVADAMDKFWKSTNMGRMLSNTFVPGYNIGNDILHRTQQITANVSSAKWESDLKNIKAVFDGKAPGFVKTSVKDRQAITHALANGDPKYLPPHLQPHYAEARRILDDAAALKVSAGIMDAKSIQQNFVPHHYRRPDKLPPGTRRFASLDYAEQMGVQPRTDIAELLSLHLADTYRSVGRQELINSFGTMFGVQRTGGRTRQASEIKRLLNKNELVKGEKIHFSLKGYVFDREIARSMQQTLKIFNSTDEAGELLRVYDSALGRIKFILTAPNPGFNIRNFIGDVFVNYLDGIADPRTYRAAQRVLQNDSGDIVKAIDKFPALDAQDLHMWYDGLGLRSGFFHADVGKGDAGSIWSKVRESPVGEASGRATGALTSSVRRFSEAREDFTRMAHFIGAYEDEARRGAKSVEAAMEAAAMRVRKFNFDYQDLTYAERTFFKRVIPFYTYMRKSIPLQISMLFAQPGKVSAVNKNMRALAYMMGTADQDESIPGVDSVIPKWLSDMTSVQLMNESENQDAVYWAPDLPIQQLNSFFGGFDEGVVPGIEQFGKETVSGLTPIARIPIEQFTGYDLATGAPVSDSWFDRAVSLAPGARAMVSDSDKDALHKGPSYDIGPFTVSESLLNYLSGAGIRKVTPARQRSEIMRRDEALKAALKEDATATRIDPKEFPSPAEIILNRLRIKGN